MKTERSRKEMPASPCAFLLPAQRASPAGCCGPWARPLWVCPAPRPQLCPPGSSKHAPACARLWRGCREQRRAAECHQGAAPRGSLPRALCQQDPAARGWLSHVPCHTRHLWGIWLRAGVSLALTCPCQSCQSCSRPAAGRPGSVDEDIRAAADIQGVGPGLQAPAGGAGHSPGPGCRGGRPSRRCCLTLVHTLLSLIKMMLLILSLFLCTVDPFPACFLPFLVRLPPGCAPVSHPDLE